MKRFEKGEIKEILQATGVVLLIWLVGCIIIFAL